MKTDKNYPKMSLFMLMGVMTLAVLYYEAFFFYHESPARTRLFSMKWLLFPHILCGSAAFLLGPIQFSSRLRKRNLRLHRLSGKVYVFSILLGASIAIAMSRIYPMADAHFMFENIIQAAVWLLTTVMAWLAARNKQIGLHKLWMARSYSVTFIFVLSRVFSPLPFFSQMSSETFTHFLWFLLVLSLLLPDLLMNWKILLIRQS